MKKTTEIWKDVPGYENRYLISSFGNLKSIIYPNHHLILKPDFIRGYKFKIKKR